MKFKDFKYPVLCLFSFVGGFVACDVLRSMLKKQWAPNTAILKLKNALLVLALIMTCPQVFESKEYMLYDGDSLPNPYGANTWRACSMYMHRWDDEKKRDFQDRMEAIMKYLDANLSTDEQIRLFFKAYTKQLSINRFE